ncbi:MAG: ribosomal protein [Actinomycetota bacterium]|jgi:large subunit ribosomal protein L13
MRTYSAKPTEVQRAWHVIDADGLVLGRMCTEIATLLRGKHKPSFTPSIDTGDHVIVINASKVVLTSGKAEDKKVARHSGYPGGIRVEKYSQFLSRSPESAIRRTVHGMLPKGRLGRAQIKKLQVYSGAEHPHVAQQPQPVDMSHAKAR